MESVTVVTEPLLHRDFVQFEIVVPILERLSRRYDVTLAAPRIAPDVQTELERRGISAADGGAKFPAIRRPRDEIPSFIGSWARDAIWGLNRKDIERALEGTDGIRINASMTTAIDADVWIIQSRPLGLGLGAMRQGVNRSLRLALGVANPFVGRLDLHHLLDAGRRARERYTTTQHVADWFGSKGMPVAGIMPMYYRTTIHRSSANPSRDYILVYVGKETDSSALRMLLDTGLPVTLFGSKSVGWVKKSLRLDRYPHVRLLGHVSDQQLSELYTNARFTAFPFTEEPFGLVPLESMACGTPVLTYGEQGPGESVVDGRTGWLAYSQNEFVRRGVEIWNTGTPSSLMVERCLERARNYHLDTVGAGWDRLIEMAFESSGAPLSPIHPRTWVRPSPSAQIGVFPTVRSFAVASGPDQILPRPNLSRPPAMPTFPIRNPSPARSPPTPSFSRSGAYYGPTQPDRGVSIPDDRSSEDSLSYSSETEPEYPTSIAAATPRRGSTDGTPATTL